jgi:hypothetical protein
MTPEHEKAVKSQNLLEHKGGYMPKGDWLVALGDGKVPVSKFGGWHVEYGPAPSARQAVWDHENTYNIGDIKLGDLSDRLEETGMSALLLDIDDANLVILDFDYEPDDPDVAGGKWGDRDELLSHLRERFPGQLFWGSQNGGVQVPALLTDEAYEQVFENEWGPGHGVDSLKGPAAKGYTAAPLSPGYGVIQSGGMPIWGVNDLESMEEFQSSSPAAPDLESAPELSPEELDVDETTDPEVVAAAVRRLDPDDFRMPARETNVKDGERYYDPSFYRSTSGSESLSYWDEKGLWTDWKLGTGMYADKLVALDMGLISDPRERLEGGDWWKAVERLRELGANIPEMVGPQDECVADLESVDAMERGGNESLLWELRYDFAEQMREAVDRGKNGHIVGPKGVGKTHNVVALAGSRGSVQMDGVEAVQGEFQEVDGKTEFVEEGREVDPEATEERPPLAVFAPTKQKYREIIEEADDKGVSVLRLPSFPEHSPLWSEWEDEYLRGAFPREIYTWDDRDTGDQDEYKRRQGEDFDDYDLLVGAPQHAFVESVTEGRVCIFDDADLGAYRDVLGRKTKNQINYVLEEIDCAVNSWVDLRGADWEPIEAGIIRHITSATDLYDEDGNFDDPDNLWQLLEGRVDEVTAKVDRRKFLSRLPGVSLDIIDWMRALTGHLHSSDAWEDRGMRLVTAEDQYMLVRAPDLSEAAQVFTMGAVPASEQLEKAFEDMHVEYEGMFGSARHGDMERAINRFVIQTSAHVHNKSSDYENVERIEALREAVGALGRESGFDEDVHVFSTLREACAVAGVETSDQLKEVNHVSNYGSLVGTNEHARQHLAVVGGSQHFGDDHVKIEAAYAGARPQDPASDGPFKPRRWDDPVHAAIEKRMRSNGLYEAITRMGRNDTELTIVAADTCELPEWLQVIDQSNRVGHLSPSARDLYQHIKDSDDAVFIKDGEGGGAVHELDYSAPALYAARDELEEAGFVELCETGKYGAEGYRDTEEEPVNRGLLGLRRRELTGSDVSEAQNPEWDVQRFETGTSTETTELRETKPNANGYVRVAEDGITDQPESVVRAQLEQKNLSDS